jgi:hypothetical protein
MSRYAENTSVSAEKSRAEIEAVLRRYGADQFAYMTSRSEARVGFVASGRQVQFRLEMPDPADREFTLTPTGRDRSSAQAEAAWEQATRQRWRALALVIKAKLEAVEAGITEFDDEFLAHIMLPNGRTIGDSLKPQLDDVYAGSRMLELMP